MPVFSELLEQKKRKEAIELAGALAGLMLVALTLVSLLFIVIAPVADPAVHGRASSRPRWTRWRSG